MKSKPSPLPDLTTRQLEVYDFIVTFTLENGYQPGQREIAEVVLGSVNNLNAVSGHLRALAQKGWLGGAHSRSRALAILRKPDGTPFRGFTFKES